MRVLTTSRIGSTTRRNVTKLLRSSKLRCNGMTLTAVEMLFAFLIDFPLAAAKRSEGPRRNSHVCQTDHTFVDRGRVKT